jgi:PiT family inorganic phosphate transporter
MTATVLLFLAALFVSYANGANDNFKGVATLFGSNTASYRSALALATLATFAGALCSIYLAGALMQVFSGNGLVPAGVAASPGFRLAVAAGAGATIFLATLLGFPISTTHALTGALVGSGLIAAGSQLDLARLGSAFFAPLLLSPVLAVLLVMPLYRALRALARRFGIRRESCICVGAREYVPVGMPVAGLGAVDVAVGTQGDCVERYAGRVIGLSAQSFVSALHYLSAGTVSFARGLNDTPKILALLLVVQALHVRLGVLAVALAMVAGGLLNARKVALTMSRKIARMNDGQALTANLVTGLLVIFASRFGLPVSTTHVCVGAIGGIGLVNRSADKRVIGGILASWLLTLPIAAAIGATVYAFLS